MFKKEPPKAECKHKLLYLSHSFDEKDYYTCIICNRSIAYVAQGKKIGS